MYQGHGASAETPARRRGGRPPGGGGRPLFTAITDDDTEHLFTVGADGRGLRRVGRDDAGELDPAWSPDGRRLGFVRDGNLFISRADGSGGARLRTGMRLTSGARWHPAP